MNRVQLTAAAPDGHRLGRSDGAFRVAPYAIHEMNAKLTIPDLDFADFAEAAKGNSGGVFRGLGRFHRITSPTR